MEVGAKIKEFFELTLGPLRRQSGRFRFLDAGGAAPSFLPYHFLLSGVTLLKSLIGSLQGRVAVAEGAQFRFQIGALLDQAGNFPVLPDIRRIFLGNQCFGPFYKAFQIADPLPVRSISL